MTVMAALMGPFGQWMSGRLPSAECRLFSLVFDPACHITLPHLCWARVRNLITHSELLLFKSIHSTTSAFIWQHGITLLNVIIPHIKSWWKAINKKYDKKQMEISIWACFRLHLSSVCGPQHIMSLLQNSSQLFLYFSGCSASGCVEDAI